MLCGVPATWTQRCVGSLVEISINTVLIVVAVLYSVCTVCMDTYSVQYQAMAFVALCSRQVQYLSRACGCGQVPITLEAACKDHRGLILISIVVAFRFLMQTVPRGARGT